MQPGAQRVELDLDLRPEIGDQPVQRGPFGRTDVRGGHHPQRYSAPSQFPEFGLQQPESVPLDECAEQVDLVGGGQFGAQFGAEGRFAVRVGQQRRIGQRGAWAVRRDRREPRPGGTGQRPQLARIVLRTIVANAQAGQDPVDHFDASLGGAFAGQRPLDGVVHVPGQDARLIDRIDRRDLRHQELLRVQPGAQPRRHQALVQPLRQPTGGLS